MRTRSAPAIRLKDYTPPPYRILEVDLLVQLDPDATRVVSKLRVRRERSTEKGEPLDLDGDELTLVSIAVDGKAIDSADYDASEQRLRITKLPKATEFRIEIETSLTPANNTKLMGLYQSNGVYCTQCEAEGFRRITYFQDRPDVLAVYTVRIEAEKLSCPHLLSNGNPIASGSLSDERHFAVWHDPHPKPCYLFALVGGDLDVLPDSFNTTSGKHVDLNIYVEKGKAHLAKFAMDALKRSMQWDEEVYGREYDLDVFNIVAVSDFNMGAMENKGLNVFNDKYVLANSNLATDTDYMHIEAIVAHEYFHNWTGNRITCRDWFQLCLKEGLTVYRDQEFSADQRSRAVQRIQQVRTLKSAQFAEDAGPLAHSVRPSAYREINNFYTATVYQKGAELVRMIATLLGPDKFRAGMDLYFQRHDGEAAVVEDFISSFEDAGGYDLSQFKRWYSQAGTPLVRVAEEFNETQGVLTLTFQQSVAPTPGQNRKMLVPIPIRFGLIGPDGATVPIRSTSRAVQNDLIVLDRRKAKVVFHGLDAKPVVSLLRGFSAPVNIDYRESDDARIVRAEFDTDLYNRWEALNGFALAIMADASRGKPSPVSQVRLVETLARTALDDTLGPEFRAQALTLPSAQDIARALSNNVDADAVGDARNALVAALGAKLGSSGYDLITRLGGPDHQLDELQAAGRRALKNALLPILLAANVEGTLTTARDQFRQALNMTDRLGALNALVHWQNDSEIADEALEAMRREFEDEPLVIDKWLALQATIGGSAGIERVQRLASGPMFTLNNPNRARSLLGAFASANLTAFHRADGAGYVFFADQILALDEINPQVAARLLTLMNNWKIFNAPRREKAELELRRIADQKGLSRDVQEIVDRSLT